MAKKPKPKTITIQYIYPNGQSSYFTTADEEVDYLDHLLASVPEADWEPYQSVRQAQGAAEYAVQKATIHVQQFRDNQLVKTPAEVVRLNTGEVMLSKAGVDALSSNVRS